MLDYTLEVNRHSDSVQPREWFLVPLSVIDEVVGKIRDGSIAGLQYDPKTAKLTSADKVN